MRRTSTNEEESQHTEEDGGRARDGAAGEGGSRNVAALVKGNELVEVVEIGEHLENKHRIQKRTINAFSSPTLTQFEFRIVSTQ